MVAHFSVAEAVDRIKAAQALQKRCTEQDRHLEIFLEANISGEESKHGFEAEALPEALDAVRSLDRLRVKGLMTMAPWGAEEEMLRQCFGGLRRLNDTLGLSGCSMGMTDDFEIAVEEGSTEVRIGRALFE